MKRTRRHHSPEFKQEAVALVVEHGSRRPIKHQSQPHGESGSFGTGRLDDFYDHTGSMTLGVCVRPNRVATATDCSGQKRIHRIYEIGATSLNQ